MVSYLIQYYLGSGAIFLEKMLSEMIIKSKILMLMLISIQTYYINILIQTY